MAGKNRCTEFRLFPTYRRAYIRAFGKMLDVIQAGGGETKWRTAEDVFSVRRWEHGFLPHIV